MLRFHPARPQLQGLESHLALMLKQIGDFDPAVVVIDPVTNLTEIGSSTGSQNDAYATGGFFQGRARSLRC